MLDAEHLCEWQADCVFACQFVNAWILIIQAILLDILLFFLIKLNSTFFGFDSPWLLWHVIWKSGQPSTNIMNMNTIEEPFFIQFDLFWIVLLQMQINPQWRCVTTNDNNAISSSTWAIAEVELSNLSSTDNNCHWIAAANNNHYSQPAMAVSSVFSFQNLG